MTRESLERKIRNEFDGLPEYDINKLVSKIGYTECLTCNKTFLSEDIYRVRRCKQCKVCTSISIFEEDVHLVNPTGRVRTSENLIS
jgi:hypothetical protein